MPRELVWAAVGWGALHMALCHVSAAGADFTVEDDIAFNRLMAPTDGDRRAVAQWSRDRSHFFAVTARGDLGTNSKVYSILLYQTRHLRLDSKPPEPTTVITVATRTNTPGIGSARWLDDSRISFLGNFGEGPTQVYVVSVKGEVKQLTHHGTSVLGYAVAADGRTMVVEAPKLPASLDEVSAGYIAGNQMLLRLYGVGMRFPMFRVGEFFEVDVASGNERQLFVPEHVSFEFGNGPTISVSPRGDWALISTRNLEPPSGVSYSSPEFFYPAYVLVNMRMAATGVTGSWLDLHMSGDDHNGFTDVQAGWAADGSSLFLARSRRPEDRKLKIPTDIRVVDLRTRNSTIVANLPASQEVMSLQVYSSADVEVLSRSGGREFLTRYVKRGETWLQRGRERDVSPDLEVRVQQDINTPPDLFAIWKKSGRQIRLTKLNPQLAEISMGRAMEVRWQDESGRTWTGGLLEPPNFVDGHRYPLVVQTHGYFPGRFWLNGPVPDMTSGYAARALGGRGMLVLQVPDDYVSIGSPEEIRANVQLLVGGVRALVEQGLADPRHVGIHGSSRSGFVVQGVLYDCGSDVAAASVAEADEVSRDEYMKGFGANSYASMSGFETMFGVPPLFDDESSEAWRERDPTNHLNRILAPVLIQAYKAGLGEWWDMYAILRRNRRPVEYMYFPDSAHVPQKPLERLMAQGSVVDWYDFWLTGHTDDRPEKREQYARWNELKRWRDDSDQDRFGSSAHCWNVSSHASQ
jgi:dipeptidyl aminopeptidase/acylaminoacyl peptidase